jgi:hypothetical protein
VERRVEELLSMSARDGAKSGSNQHQGAGSSPGGGGGMVYGYVYQSCRGQQYKG